MSEIDICCVRSKSADDVTLFAGGASMYRRRRRETTLDDAAKRETLLSPAGRDSPWPIFDVSISLFFYLFFPRFLIRLGRLSYRYSLPHFRVVDGNFAVSRRESSSFVTLKELFLFFLPSADLVLSSATLPLRRRFTRVPFEAGATHPSSSMF